MDPAAIARIKELEDQLAAAHREIETLRVQLQHSAATKDSATDDDEDPILTAPAAALRVSCVGPSPACSPGPDDDAPAGSVSERIRRRIVAVAADGKPARYFSNDNIARFIAGPSELLELEAEVAAKFSEVLRSLVIDVDRDHNTHETARRVAKMYVREVFSGRYTPQPAVTSFPNAADTEDLFVVGPIDVRSTCSHHFCPIRGKLWVGVLPCATSRLIGLSKFGRIAEWVAARPQIQEEAVAQMADALETHVQPKGIALYLDAEHTCTTSRGVRHAGCSMGSLCFRGVFKSDVAARQEFMTMVARSGGGSRMSAVM